MPVTTQQNQYVQPVKNPAQGPSRSAAKSLKDLYSRFDSSSSPIARMTKKSIKPMIMYTKITDGPATEIVLPDPMNRPVPIAPPIAISWICRLDNCRARWGSWPPEEAGRGWLLDGGTEAVPVFRSDMQISLFLIAAPQAAASMNGDGLRWCAYPRP